MSDEIKARLMEKVEKNENGCWIWNASKFKSGYGQFKLNGRNRRAHCVSYEIFKGERNGLHVLHSCDIRSCVNPDHLHLGTHAKNMKEKVERNRQSHPTGEKNGRAILTEEMVLSIKKAFKDDTIKKGRRERLREKFPTVPEGNLYLIIYGKRWKHLQY